MRMRTTKRRWGPWEQAWSSSRSGAGSEVWEEACLEGAPRECRVRAASAAVHRGLSQLCGAAQEEEEEEDPSVLGGGGEVCLCGEMLPEGEK